MIKYVIEPGPEHVKAKARAKRDFFKKVLSGMKCKPGHQDTVFTFSQHTGFLGSGSVDTHIDACCPEFRKLIDEKLGSVPTY
ncbi:hypothetical protein BWI93_10105 [Siphonobacter sp. BAB-5385]|uniref:hypothetical protein n=1 Tax=Siphonobacter sp. BAB-5385 TaxID=1864822 RepID=UPI000B9ED8B7|nr:hypothetical protein [Siphonobacter sp. BAB-5385]OZI08212.1 hypothetical protein BWI93_10105 [Siphonobacter sp. BAB-5385]